MRSQLHSKASQDLLLPAQAIVKLNTDKPRRHDLHAHIVAIARCQQPQSGGTVWESDDPVKHCSDTGKHCTQQVTNGCRLSSLGVLAFIPCLHKMGRNMVMLSQQSAARNLETRTLYAGAKSPTCLPYKHPKVSHATLGWLLNLQLDVAHLCSA